MDFARARGKSILNIDLDFILLKDMKTILEDVEGYNFDCALDLKEGFKKLVRGRYDLVIIEPAMIVEPNKEGYNLKRMSVALPKIWDDTLEIIRADKMPCMFFSCFDEEKAPEEYRLAGERGYSFMLKPSPTIDLLRMIWKQTEGERGELFVPKPRPVLNFLINLYDSIKDKKVA
jgi:hypothetical protein